MCGSMVDIQSVAAEIRQGKKERERKKETTGQKYNVRIRRAAIINGTYIMQMNTILESKSKQHVSIYTLSIDFAHVNT